MSRAGNAKQGRRGGSHRFEARLEQLEGRVLLSGDSLIPTHASTVETMQWLGANVEVVKDSWLVHFHEAPQTPSAAAAISPVLSMLGLEADDAANIRRIGLGFTYVFETARDLSANRVYDAVSFMGNLSSISPNFVYRPFVEPNDPDLPTQQWWHNNTGQVIEGVAGVPDADIDTPEAWDSTIGSQNVIIAVIDTGVDLQHPDLIDNIWRNPGESGLDAQGNDRATNGIDDDGNGFVDDVSGWDFGVLDNDPDDVEGHGTQVAGTIAAVGNNASGGVGVGWNLSILPMKIARADGSLSNDAIIGAHDYLTMMIGRGFNIVASNNSYGAFAPDFYDENPTGLNPERDAIRRFVDTGATFVAAAGNDSNDNDGDFTAFPASYDIDEIISVAATTNTDALAGFSNFGATQVDVAAPGQGIWSTAVGGGYAFTQGTSFASPITAGVVGLMKTLRPDATQAMIKQALIESSDPVPGLNGMVVANGRINAANALLRIDELGATGPTVLDVFPGVVSGPTNHVDVMFTRDIDPAFFDISDVTLSRNGQPLTLTADNVELDGTVLSITFAGQLALGNYTLVLDADGFRDETGEFLNGDAVNGQDFIYNFQINASSGALEVNDFLARATPVVYRDGELQTFGGLSIGDGPQASLDVDLFRIRLNEPGLIRARVNAQALSTPSTLDSYLRLFDASGQEITSNDNFNGLDSRMDYFVPSKGTYYIGVSGFGNGAYNPIAAPTGAPASTGDYALDIEVDVVGEATAEKSSTATPIALPTTGVITDSITFSDTRDLTDVNISVALTHSFISDLELRLISPQGTVVPLMLRRGGDGDGLGRADGPDPLPMFFDDDAAQSITTATPTTLPGGERVFIGSFTPEGDLTALFGESIFGTWRLEITDTRPLDSGVLLDWGLDFTLRNSLFGPFESNDTLASATELTINGTGSRTLEAFVGDGAFGLRDVDLFRFTADSGSSIVATVTPTGNTGLNTVLRLFDSVGNEVVLSEPNGLQGATLTHIVGAGEDFYIGVSAGGNSDYDPQNPGVGTIGDSAGEYSLRLTVAGGITNGAVVLDGERLDTVVESDGSIGLAGQNSLGLRVDGVEYLLPAGAADLTSFFGATYDGHIFRNAGADGSDLPVAVTSESDAFNRRTVVAGLFRPRFDAPGAGGLRVSRTLSYGLGDGFIAVDVRLINQTSENVGNIAWMEGFNPQQGTYAPVPELRTSNDVNGRLVTASFAGIGAIGLGAAETPAGVSVIPSVESSDDIRDPFQIINTNGTDPNGASADSVIALAYDIGDLDAGESVSFRYFIFTGATQAAVASLFQQVEDGTGTGHLVADPLVPAVTSDDAESLPYAVYYPEGFASANSSTFVPIVNPNSRDARVVVIARYETGEARQVLFDEVIEGNTRQRLTINDPTLFQIEDRTGLVRRNTPYALEIRSSAPVGATIGHYDFNNIATGESFTSDTSTVWTFGEGFKGANARDFAVFLNTTDQANKVTLTIYPEGPGEVLSFTQEVAANRRGGWSIRDLPGVPNGPFGMRLDAEQPIVAALTHFDTGFNGGFGVLGVPSAGSLTGATPEGQFGINADAEFVTVLNTNNQPAEVTFTFFFTSGSAYRQTFTVPAQRRGGLNIGQLANFPTGEAFSIAYESNVPVSVALPSFAFGEATGSYFAGQARTVWTFGEGFFSVSDPESVQQYIRIYNPSEEATTVEITLDFDDGTSETFGVDVEPRTANEFDVHDFITGQRRTVGTVPGVGTFYGIRVKGGSPIVAYFGYFDSTLGGGFGTLGTPLGVAGDVI